MIRCEHCGRHHLGEESSCPFCGQGGGLGRKIKNAALVASTMVLMACYGPAGMYVDDTSLQDADADGFFVGEDCDDADPAVHPEAAEVCDDSIDNDCDGMIDAEDVDDCPVE
jgi:hypothetical protein